MQRKTVNLTTGERKDVVVEMFKDSNRIIILRDNPVEFGQFFSIEMCPENHPTLRIMTFETVKDVRGAIHKIIIEDGWETVKYDEDILGDKCLLWDETVESLYEDKYEEELEVTEETFDPQQWIDSGEPSDKLYVRKSETEEIKPIKEEEK